MAKAMWTTQEGEARARTSDDPCTFERHYDRLFAEAERELALREFWRMGQRVYREKVARRSPGDPAPVPPEDGRREAR